MQKKWIITATAATLSLGVLGAAAAYTATTAHLADEHGTSIGGGVEGSSRTAPQSQEQIDRLNGALETVLRGDPASAPTAASAVDDPPSDPPAQTQQPTQTQQPAPNPQPAPAPAPQSLPSVSAPSPASVDSPPSND